MNVASLQVTQNNLIREILSHLNQACQEYQQIKQGKMKAVSKEELLNDL